MPRTDTVNAENVHTPSHRERDGQARGYAIILGLLIVSYGFCAAQPSTDPSPWAFLAMLATVAMVFYVTRARHLVQRVWWVVLSVAGAAAVIAALFGVDGPVLAIPLSAASMLALLSLRGPSSRIRSTGGASTWRRCWRRSRPTSWSGCSSPSSTT